MNYFLGSDPARWRRNIPTYAKVRYRQVYPGIDAIFYGNQRQLEYDLVVAPGADASHIRLSFRGAKRARVDRDGSLVLSTLAGEVRQPRPLVYQQIDGRRRAVPAGYAMLRPRATRPGETVNVAFRLGAYDPRRTLVIDPKLVASSLLGGSGDDFSRGIAVDGDGNAYLGGVTDSQDFPGSGFRSPQNPNSSNAYTFVAKFNPDFSQLLYASIIGGLDQGGYGDEQEGIAVDPDGNAWVGGWTTSHDFPTTPNGLEPAYPGGTFYRNTAEGFISKLSADGSQLLYSSYFGGGNSGQTTQIFAVATGLGGRVYFTGATLGSIPVKNAPQPALVQSGLFTDAFVTSLDPNGVLLYSTYLGGSGSDVGLGIAVGATGVACVMGETGSTIDPNNPASKPFPTTPGALQTSYAGGGDAFVTTVADLGGQFFYSTYLGGSGEDAVQSTADPPSGGIAVDGEGNVYVTGTTRSKDFPTTPGAFQTSFQGSDTDVFVTKIRPDARLPVDQQLLYSTYLGSPLDESGRGIAVDSQLNAYVAGFTQSPNFPTVNGFTNRGTAFVSVLNPEGSGLIYSTRLGADPNDECSGVALGVFGDIYVAGDTDAGPTPWPASDNAFQTQYHGRKELFAMRLRIADSDLQITGCGLSTDTVPASGGPVTITATAQSIFGVASMTAHILHPNGPAIDLPMSLDANTGQYSVVFNVPASAGLEPEGYTVSIVATDRSGAEASASCGTVTLVAQKVIVTDCSATPMSLPHAGGNVSISATVISSEKLKSPGGVLALVSLQPNGPQTRVTLALSKGAYSGTWHAPANKTPQDRNYDVSVEATTRSGAQATMSCGTVTVALRPLPVIQSCDVAPRSLTSKGGAVTITATVTSVEGVRSVSATVSPQPAGAKVQVPMTLKNGQYVGTFHAPLNSKTQEKDYGVIVRATSKNGAQGSQDCGSFSVAGK